MFKIILHSAVRSLIKAKHISLINLIGLVVGLTSFLFTLHYLLFEFSYDTFFNKHEQVYRINLEITKDGQTIYHGAKTPRAMFFALKNELPELEANGISYFEKCLVSYEDVSYTNQDVLWVDEGFEKVFPLEMISGVADYSRPETGIISATSAKALFGNLDPIGKIMGVNQGMPIEITGVFQDLPANTHLSASYFASIKTWVKMEAISESGDWQGNSWWNYIRISDAASAEQVEAKINNIAETYMTHLANDNREATFSLQPLKNLHYISGMEGEMGATTNYASLKNLIIIVLVTLIIAWINYVNLSTAHAQSRTGQIGIRKLIGASRMHLWYQSLTECIMINIVAVIISFLIYILLLNWFAHLFFLPISEAYLPVRYLFLILAATLFAGILFSSIYYAIELASINILSKQEKPSGRGFKNGLVMVQIVISIVFLICTITVYKQISFMKNKDLGIALNDVIICTGPASLNADHFKRQRFEGFKSHLLEYAGFEAATFNLHVPGQEPRMGLIEMHNPGLGINPDVMFFENNATQGFLETYKLKLLAGRDFSPEASQNHNRIIINETSRRLLGFKTPDDALGQYIFHKRDDAEGLEIIGVVADFHNEGLQKPIYPIVWNNNYPREFGYFSIRINSSNVHESVEILRTVWKQHYSKDNLDFVFANDQFNKQYESESRFGLFYLWLTVLSIGIAAMGLYGLILFYLSKRKVEIGIRKVNGAKIWEVMTLLNKDFVKWVFISLIIATPIAYYAMNQWLENFAYKTELSWWIFVLAGVLALGIALLTVSWQSYKAATRNPVEALRYE